MYKSSWKIFVRGVCKSLSRKLREFKEKGGDWNGFPLDVFLREGTTRVKNHVTLWTTPENNNILSDETLDARDKESD